MRTGWMMAAFGLLATVAVTAQQRHPKTTAPLRDQNGAATRATHRPDRVLRPLLVWEYVQRSHARALANRKAGDRSTGAGGPHGGQPSQAHSKPQPLPRPAFAGRYLCAVFICSGCDLDIVKLLGLPRRDVLVVQTPGPFVQPESVALIERMVQRHHLSLVLILGDERSELLQLPRKEQPADALTRRVVALQARARKYQQKLPVALVHRQRELLLASSQLLTRRNRDDKLRIMPGIVDSRSGTIQWHTRNANAMPIPPVKGKVSRK